MVASFVTRPRLDCVPVMSLGRTVATNDPGAFSCPNQSASRMIPMPSSTDNTPSARQQNVALDPTSVCVAICVTDDDGNATGRLEATRTPVADASNHPAPATAHT